MGVMVNLGKVDHTNQNDSRTMVWIWDLIHQGDPTISIPAQK